MAESTRTAITAMFTIALSVSIFVTKVICIYYILLTQLHLPQHTAFWATALSALL